MKRHPWNDSLNLVEANKEYAYRLPGNLTSLYLKSRTSKPIQVAFKKGMSDKTFFTISEGAAYKEDNISTAGVDCLCIHVRCATAGEVLEIIGWNQ